MGSCQDSDVWPDLSPGFALGLHSAPAQVPHRQDEQRPAWKHWVVYEASCSVLMLVFWVTGQPKGICDTSSVVRNPMFLKEILGEGKRGRTI